MKPVSTATATDGPPAGISTRLAVLLAVASGVAVANIYYAQPLLDQIGRDLRVGPAGLGLVTTVTQAGYFLGLILIVPLGDLINRRALIVAGCVVAAAALAAVALSPDARIFLIASGVVGVVSVVQQVINAYAAGLSSPEIARPHHRDRHQRCRLRRPARPDRVGNPRRRPRLAIGLRLLGGAHAGARARPCSPAATRKPPGSPSPTAASITSVVALTVHERVFRVRSPDHVARLRRLRRALGIDGNSVDGRPVASVDHRGGPVRSCRRCRRDRRCARRCLRRSRTRAMGHGNQPCPVPLSWAFIAWLPNSLIVLIVGIVILDLAGQAISVTNQHVIVEIDPTASSRLIGGNTVYYAVGTGGGAIAATTVFSVWGWSAVCIFGAGLSALAILIWSGDRFFSTAADPLLIRPDSHLKWR